MSSLVKRSPIESSTKYRSSLPSTASGWSNSYEKSPTGWRYKILRRREENLNEHHEDSKTTSDYRLSFPPNDVKIVQDLKRPRLLRQVYVDQQTGEMRVTATGHVVNQPLDGENELDHICTRRNPADLRWRKRQSQAISNKSPRSFWDQSLQSKSIVINTRASLPPSKILLLPQSVPCNRVRSFLPRVSRSAESSSTTYETPLRYPRGQQRPTGLASSHHALLSRHKQIMEASKRSSSGTNWSHGINRYYDENLYDLLKHQTPDLLSRANQNSLRHLSIHRNFLRTQNGPLPIKRCSQEANSVLKANKKCQEWFNTWIED